MGTKRTDVLRSSAAVPVTPSRSFSGKKYLRFSLISTPPSEVSRQSAEPRSECLFSPSFQQKHVLLFEWWLMKEKSHSGKGIAVGGFTKRGEAVVKFSSAPIVKRHDGCTLETADEITIRIQGPINKTRTSDNGFPLEVCTAFLFGFPTSWDIFTERSSEPEPIVYPSTQQKTVMLRNWWLRKTDKGSDRNMLAVGGFNEWGKAMRIFNSSPVTKRHDCFTLETTDGVTIRIQGFINQTRTLDNGFSLEACKAFLIGFPTTWTDFTTNSSSYKTSHSETPGNDSIDAERYNNYLESLSLGFPVDSENTPSTSNTSIYDSATRIKEAIHEFLAQEFKNVNLPLVDKSSHSFPEEGLCNNILFQVDESYQTNMRCDTLADKCHENHEADHGSVKKCLSGSKTSVTSQHNGVSVKRAPTSPNLYGENLNFVKASAKPVRRSGRLMLATLGNINAGSNNSFQFLDETDNTNSTSLAYKISSTILPKDTMLTGNFSSLTGRIHLPSAGALSEQDQDGHLCSSNTHLGVVSEAAIFTCDNIVRPVEETPTTSKTFNSPNLEKNVLGYCRKKKDNQTVRSGGRVEQNGSRDQPYSARSARRMASHFILLVDKNMVHCTPLSHCTKNKLSIATPSLSVKRSRSGRIIIPKLDCSTTIIYEADGSIAGVANIDGSVA